jgi:hypothetical protein
LEESGGATFAPWQNYSMELILGIPIWILFGILGAWIATTKGRSGCGWFIICSLLGPIGLILAAVISKKG